jgi:hypothetical protein
MIMKNFLTVIVLLKLLIASANAQAIDRRLPQNLQKLLYGSNPSPYIIALADRFGPVGWAKCDAAQTYVQIRERSGHIDATPFYYDRDGYMLALGTAGAYIESKGLFKDLKTNQYQLSENEGMKFKNVNVIYATNRDCLLEFNSVWINKICTESASCALYGPIKIRLK